MATEHRTRVATDPRTQDLATLEDRLEKGAALLWADEQAHETGTPRYEARMALFLALLASYEARANGAEPWVDEDVMRVEIAPTELSQAAKLAAALTDTSPMVRPSPASGGHSHMLMHDLAVPPCRILGHTETWEGDAGMTNCVICHPRPERGRGRVDTASGVARATE